MLDERFGAGDERTKASQGFPHRAHGDVHLSGETEVLDRAASSGAEAPDGVGLIDHRPSSVTAS